MNIQKWSGYWLAICFLVLFSSSLAWAAQSKALPDGLGVHVEYAHQGKTVWATVWLTMRQDYHAYAHDIGGDTGLPTTINIKRGKAALPVFYPAGQLRRDVYTPSKMVRVYAGRVPLFVRLDKIASGQEVHASLQLLLCSVKHCLPVNTSLVLRPPKVETLPAMADTPFAAQWKAALGKNPPVEEKQADSEAAAASTRTFALVEDAASLSGSAGQDATGAISTVGLAQGSDWVFSPRSVQEDLEVGGLGKALLLGLLAGLLLNFMPCVLPVLTLKASAMLVVGEGDKQSRLAAFRVHNVLFAAGIITQFLLLAIILGTAGLIWGQIFQSLAFVSTMLVVVFLLGLSMLGLFTLPVIDLKASASRSPRMQAYLTGIMATLLATPCSGPLLGGVLSWAFMQPQTVLIAVFLAVGVGMSIPYVIFALNPTLAMFLPRPGAWMAVLERLVGFFLLGTSLYLLSILPQDLHMPMLAALLLVAMGGWVWGFWGGLSAPPLRRKLLGLLLSLLVGSVIYFGAHPPVNEVNWEQFDVATFKAELGKTPMMVEFTADWCPNCKFLERTVLTPKRLHRWQQRYGLKLVRVDLTRPNAEGEALLQALGSSSIPLTAIFNKGLTASAPVVVRDIYTVETLEQALSKAFP